MRPNKEDYVIFVDEKEEFSFAWFFVPTGV